MATMTPVGMRKDTENNHAAERKRVKKLNEGNPVWSFSMAPWFRDRSPQKFGLPPSGDVHVGTRRPTWLD